MESRRPIHYKRNTVTPHIKQACRDQVKNASERIFHTDEDGKPLRNKNKHFYKVVATLKCNWCEREMGEYRTVCPFCHNCQYCGFYSPALNQCLSCGNQAPDDLKVKVGRVKVRDIKKRHRHTDNLLSK